jgi:predicted Zn finger-like uncharacterized protein
MNSQCPYCQTQFISSDETIGKEINCPKCNQAFFISSLNKDDLRKSILAKKKAYNIKSFCWGIPGIILQTVSYVIFFIMLNEIDKTQTYNTSDQMAIGLFYILILLGSIALLIGILYYTKYLNRHWAWSLLAFVPYGVFVLAFLKDETKELYPELFVSEEIINAKMSKLALISLILGVLGIVTIVPAIPGLICGVSGIIKINKSHGALKGRFLAIMGILLSAIMCLIISYILCLSLILSNK